MQEGYIIYAELPSKFVSSSLKQKEGEKNV